MVSYGLKKDIEAFEKDANELDFMKIGGLFEILGLKETGCSEILAWLLDAKGSHGFNNKFVLALLDKCKQPCNKVYAFTSNIKKKNKYLDIDRMQEIFKETLITTEYSVETDLKKLNYSGRIDIMVLDYENNLCLVIENKYGSKVHDNQLELYQKSLFKKDKTDNMSFIFVYLDPLKDAELTDKELFYWNHLDYDFIELFLSKHMDEVKCSRAKEILKSFHNELKSENYFGDIKQLQQFAIKHQKLIAKARQYKNTTVENFFSKDFFGVKDVLDNKKLLSALYLNYEYLINKSYHYLNNKDLCNFYNDEFKNYAKDNGIIVSEYSIIKHGRLDFTLDNLAEHSKTLWFAYATIRKNDKNNKFECLVDIAPSYFDGNEEVVRKFMKTFNIEYKNNKKTNIDFTENWQEIIDKSVNMLSKISNETQSKS